MKLSIIVASLALASPAMAQNYNVVDATGAVVGPLMSDSAISQGVEVRINFTGSQCPPGPYCVESEFLLIPWSVGGMGQDYVAYFETNNMPETNWFYASNDPQCEGQPYLKVVSAKTTAAKPYDVVGGDSQAGSFYWPELTNTETAAQLDIGYKMASPMDYFYTSLQTPAYTATGACEPAWVKPTDLFAPMDRDNFESLPVAGAPDGYVSPFDVVEVQASSKKKNR